MTSSPLYPQCLADGGTGRKEGREGGKVEEREGGKQGSGEILGSDFSVLVPTGTVELTYIRLP